MKFRSEVIAMCLFEYDEERELKLMRRDERELGREEGQKNSLLIILSTKGTIPDILVEKITKGNIDCKIEEYIRLASKVNSIEEFITITHIL